MYALTRLPVSVSLLVVYALCLAGCGFMSSNGEEEPSSDTASTAEVVHVSSQNGSVDHRVQEAESDLASPDIRNAEDESTTSVEEFVPPFPNRTSMFSRPNAQKAAGLVRKRQEDRGGDLQLKGFVNVGQPRAMLQVDGQAGVARFKERFRRVIGVVEQKQNISH